MIKGAQKKMIVVRTRDSKLFEEAYFVMRHDTPYAGRDDGDIVAEANRIIRQSTVHGRVAAVDSACKKSSLFSRAVSFGIGMLTGGGICALIAIIF